ncbi:hypothetical protein PoB_003556900 [Plakobranchus ocellatus]|uniref:Uncharacterized protein n=1 Tax=Plakobranchus ocellatus TaxID=259542 RepID=A0AAV4AMQ1_9GAST|nr:hypothetical protein PoB_003556900 [Plakobranchus ocellatus]
MFVACIPRRQALDFISTTGENVEGVMDCPHLAINATTHTLVVSAEKAEDGNLGMVAAAIVVIPVVIFVIGAHNFVLIKKRNAEKSQLIGRGTKKRKYAKQRSHVME